MTTRLLLAGAGHAHLSVMGNLTELMSRGAAVTVINAEAHHYYSGMGPGMLSGRYRPDDIRIDVKRLVESQGAAFVTDRVVAVNPDTRRVRLTGGDSIHYDLVSFNIGSGVVPPPGEGGGRVFPVKPISGLIDLQETVIRELAEGPLRVTVVGGGAAGVEVAGNLRALGDRRGGDLRVSLITGGRLLTGFHPKARTTVIRAFTSRGIAVTENQRVAGLSPEGLQLADGSHAPGVAETASDLRGFQIFWKPRRSIDLIVLATGIAPSPVFRDSGVPTGPDGGLRVNACLQSVAHPEIFGGGDCIHFDPRPLRRIGVYAVRQNPVLRHNLMAALTGHPLVPFRPQKSFMLIINLGDGTGVLCREGLIIRSRLAFWLKHWIDTRFIRSVRGRR